MGKKIRFPLKLAEGAEVRTLEELREHFDLQAILEYYKNGKLLTWLEDRYLEGEAEAIQALDESVPDFQRQLCEVFQVEYSGDDVDLEAIKRRQERLKRLRSITDDAEYIQNIDWVAFDQEELADLLDEGEEKIYLCGEHFTVPVSRKGVTYIGINNPTVHISGKLPEDAAELGIEFAGITCDNQTPGLFKSGGAATIGNQQTGQYPKNRLPTKLLQHIQSYDLKGFFETEHYYLYCCGADKNLRWFRYEISTDQEIELPDEIVQKIASISKPTYTSDRIERCFKISGDLVACIIYSSRLCTIDLNLLTMQEYPEIYVHNHQYAFSDKYFAICSDGYPTTIEVYGYHEPQWRVHKIVLTKSGELLLDGNAITTTRFSYMNSWSQINPSDIQIMDNTLCFILRAKSDYTEWLVCIDLDTADYKLFAIKSNGNRSHALLAKSNQFVYTIYRDSNSSSSNLEREEYVISSVDLRDGTLQEIFCCHSYFGASNDIILRKNDLYLTVFDRKKDLDYQICAIELATQKVKTLPYIVDYTCFHELRDTWRSLLIGKIFYCFRYQVYSSSWGMMEMGIACKFDLTEDSPQLLELES